MPFRINNKAKWSTWSVNWSSIFLALLLLCKVLRLGLVVSTLGRFKCLLSLSVNCNWTHLYFVCPLKNDFLLCAVITCAAMSFSLHRAPHHHFISFNRIWSYFCFACHFNRIKMCVMLCLVYCLHYLFWFCCCWCEENQTWFKYKTVLKKTMHQRCS